MSEYDDMTNSQPYWEDLQPRRRQCRIGDTVSDVRSPTGQAACSHWLISNALALNAVNTWMIPSGRWRVSRCGRCGDCVEECWCDDIPES